MTGVSESILRAEIASLHEQIFMLFVCSISGKKADVHDQLYRLFGMLPDDLRPDGIPKFEPHPGPFKTKKKEADDLL